MEAIRKQSTFTLIELIVVIVIVGILASIAIPKFMNLRLDAQKAACFQGAASIQTALFGYYVGAARVGDPMFPTNLHETTFNNYLTETTLPEHPMGRDWNDYYSSSANRTTYEFSVGKGGTSGACTAF